MSAVEGTNSQRQVSNEPGVLKSFLAGGVGGICLVITGHPLDTIKVGVYHESSVASSGLSNACHFRSVFRHSNRDRLSSREHLTVQFRQLDMR